MTDLDARAEALRRKDDELCKLVIEMADAERALDAREKDLAKREAKLEAGRAELARERKAVKQAAEMNIAMESGLKVRAAALDKREADFERAA